MSWGWIKKLKSFGKDVVAKSREFGKRMLHNAKGKVENALDKYVPDLKRQGQSWLDKAENFLGKVRSDVMPVPRTKPKVPIRGNIQPRYRSPSEYFNEIH
jgi:hypothetical protein